MIGRKSAVPVNQVALARERLASAAAALIDAKAEVAALDSAKSTMSLTDDVGEHIAKMQVATSRIEIAQRLRDDADAAVAAAEIAADAERKRDLHARATAAHEEAVATARRQYPALVEAATKLRAIIDAADALAAEANRTSLPGTAYLPAVEEAAYDLSYNAERIVDVSIVEKWTYAETGAVVPGYRKIQDNGDGTGIDPFVAPGGHQFAGGAQGRAVRRQTFRVERFIPAFAGAIGPRVPVLEPLPTWSTRLDREQVRETLVIEAPKGPPRMRSFAPGAMARGNAA